MTFYGDVKIYYNKKVFDPHYSGRDTIEIADKLIKDGGKDGTSVLDVACGSGVIGLSLKKRNMGIKLALSDIDKEAVRITRLNAKRNGLIADTRLADLTWGEWDIITANLPTYSEEDMKQSLNGPRQAYYAGDPLSLYRRLFEEAKAKALVCECQEKYVEKFLSLAEEAGWKLALSTDRSFAFFKV